MTSTDIHAPHARVYVAPGELIAPEPAPPSTRGAWGWARAHLFGSVSQVLLTLFGALLVLAVVPPVLRFAEGGIVISHRLHTDSQAGDCLIQVAEPIDG